MAKLAARAGLGGDEVRLLAGGLVLLLVLTLAGPPRLRMPWASRGQEGLVVVLRGLRPQALIIGAEVFADDTVRTGPASKVRIDCQNGLTIVIGPATQVQLATYVADEAGGLDVVLGLFSGIVRLIGEALPGPGASTSRPAPPWQACGRRIGWSIDAQHRRLRGARPGRGARAGRGSVVLAPGEGTTFVTGAADAGAALGCSTSRRRACAHHALSQGGPRGGHGFWWRRWSVHSGLLAIRVDDLPLVRTSSS